MNYFTLAVKGKAFWEMTKSLNDVKRLNAHLILCARVPAGEPSTPPWSRALLRKVTPLELLRRTNFPHFWGTMRAKMTSPSVKQVH